MYKTLYRLIHYLQLLKQIPNVMASNLEIVTSIVPNLTMVSSLETDTSAISDLTMSSSLVTNALANLD